MSRIERSALVSYSVEQMFDLVRDVESYPEFMGGCVGAQLLSRGDDWLEARLDLSKLGIKQSFVTRNHFVRPLWMNLGLVSGPFKHMRGQWDFKKLNDSASKVSFWLEFEFANPILALAAGKLFEQIASEQVNSICQRAEHVYSKSR